MTPIEVIDATEADLAIAAKERAALYLPLVQQKPAWSGWVGEDLVFMGGVARPWDGMGEAWLVPGPAFTKYLALIRTLRALFGVAMHDYGLRRIQCQIDSRNDTNYRFARHLGFIEEARFADYGPEGQDYVMMRWRP